MRYEPQQSGPAALGHTDCFNPSYLTATESTMLQQRAMLDLLCEAIHFPNENSYLHPDPYYEYLATRGDENLFSSTFTIRDNINLGLKLGLRAPSSFSTVIPTPPYEVEAPELTPADFALMDHDLESQLFLLSGLEPYDGHGRSHLEGNKAICESLGKDLFGGGAEGGYEAIPKDTYDVTAGDLYGVAKDSFPLPKHDLIFPETLMDVPVLSYTPQLILSSPFLNSEPYSQDTYRPRLIDQLDLQFPERPTALPKPVYCTHCVNTFTTTDDYCLHMDENGLDAVNHCPDDKCMFSVLGFRRKLDLRIHLINSHMYNFNRSSYDGKLQLLEKPFFQTCLLLLYVCVHDNCSRCFYRKDSLSRHHQLVHESPTKAKSKSKKRACAKKKRDLFY